MKSPARCSTLPPTMPASSPARRRWSTAAFRSPAAEAARGDFRVGDPSDCRHRPLIRLPPPLPARGEKGMRGNLSVPRKPFVWHVPSPRQNRERVRVRGSHRRQPDSSIHTFGNVELAARESSCAVRPEQTP
ncbi:hypothetical protein RHECNPAF_25300131 [Rhizobium etli CNPAF512]|nr:hypothetical protein RHECNPAF_25300131 [Rhizobium etli CNPAF512]